jgi:hypothetical protein
MLQPELESAMASSLRPVTRCVERFKSLLREVNVDDNAAYCMQSHDGMIPKEKTSDSSTRALWQSYKQSHLEAEQEDLAKERKSFALQSNSFILRRVFLTCRKGFLNGASGFTSPPKECVLRIFNALKNPSPSAGFEPVNLGSNGKHANH